MRRIKRAPKVTPENWQTSFDPIHIEPIHRGGSYAKWKGDEAPSFMSAAPDKTRTRGRRPSKEQEWLLLMQEKRQKL